MKTDNARTEWARKLMDTGDKLVELGKQLDRIKVPLSPDQVLFLQSEEQFNLLLLIGAPCAVVDRFAMWADYNEPHMAAAARKRVESLVKQAVYVQSFLHDQELERRFYAGESAAVQAGLDWIAFTLDVQEAGTSLRECSAALRVTGQQGAADAPRKSAAERGRLKAKVQNPRDRALIRDEVRRIAKLDGMTHSDACKDVCEQAKNGVVRGKEVLSQKYHSLKFDDVRRISKSDW